MKKTVLFAAIAAFALASCGEDEPEIDNGGNNSTVIVGGDSIASDSTDIVIEGSDAKITIENVSNWTAYARQVAALLANDAENLLKSWEESYDGGLPFATIFKNHNGNGYTSAANCIEEIIDGCADIANEVGEAKMGDPFDLWNDGKKLQALYAVESWYSWHSIDDYSNNILSIRNSYYGSLDGKVAPASISALVAEINPELDNTVKQQIALAYNAIKNIPAPFRNNINSSETRTAMAACANLDQTLSGKLKPLFEELSAEYDEKEQAIVENYVDNVVLPTYTQLKQVTANLLQAVIALAQDPSDANFATAAQAWLDARAPWELSEAFLFGPVDALGLDPNMDSWPLDQTAIVNHITSGNFADLEWNMGDDDDRIEGAQNVRGFHTLEFLLFSDGQPRKL